jgi:peroxiredoxin family protein
MSPPDDKGRLSLVVFSGDFPRVHYALAMAAAALSIGRPATLFFTMQAIRALTPNWREMPGAEADATHAARGVGRFAELLDAVVELGGAVMVCEMGMRATGIARSDLRADIPVVEGGIVTFLNQLEAGGSTLFI